MAMTRKALLRHHRTMGYELVRVSDPDGIELVVLQTDVHRQEVAPAHLLQPVSANEATLEATMQLTEAINRGRFLGLDDAALRNAFESILAQLAD